MAQAMSALYGPRPGQVITITGHARDAHAAAQAAIGAITDLPTRCASRY